MTMTNLYLIRHGEAVSNVRPIVGGMRGDTGLTALGVEQAERLRDRLAATREIEANALIASTLPRARQTAEIIAPALDLPITWDDDVQEMRPGEADGLSLHEFRAAYGEPDFGRDPFRPLAPGGEGWAQFMLRVGHALHRIAREHAGHSVVVVCHGGVIDGSFLYFFGLNTLAAPAVRLYTHNTSITHWQHAEDAETGMGHWRLLRYNDDAHLRARGREEPAVPLPIERPKQG